MPCKPSIGVSLSDRLTHNDIAHLGVTELERLWNEGKISHLVDNFEVNRSEDGKLTHITYTAKEFSQ